MARHPRPSLPRRASAFDSLEGRQMLCLVHLPAPASTDILPDVLASLGAGGSSLESTGPESGEPARIRWANRLTFDGFAGVFGSRAPLARAVVDQVFKDFEQMIGSFNYLDEGRSLNVTLMMMSPGTSGTENFGLGAAATLIERMDSIPTSGMIQIQRGLTGTGDGWFLDPTPADHSEFLGRIENPFAGDAPSTSPAYGLADFYTLVALELTHIVGLYGNELPGWDAMTRPVELPELGEGFTPPGSSVGKYWVFEGPRVKHLLTSNNGGRGGIDYNQPVHSAGHANATSPVVVDIDGQQWASVNDIGNAVYERSRRYVPTDAFALMLGDAIGYSSQPPSLRTTFHATQTVSGEVVVRIPTLASDDVVSLNVDGAGKLVVTYDLGVDSPGVGALPGYGDLPAYTTLFDASTVTGVRIETGDGADTVSLSNLGAIPVTLDAGVGADALTLVGSSNVTLVGNQDLGAIAIDAASTLALQAGVGATLLTTGGISGAGSLDLADGALIDRSADTVAQLRDRLVAGYAGGAWDGAASSVRSSVAATSASLDSLQLGIASQIVPTTLGGFALQPTDRVVRHTLAGDANLDRVVNFDDLLRLAANFNASAVLLGSAGEFSLDPSGAADFDDLLLLAANYNSSLAGGLGGAFLAGGPVSGSLVNDGDDAPSIAGDVLA